MAVRQGNTAAPGVAAGGKARPAVLGLGFRPFYLLAALYAALIVPFFLGWYAGAWPGNTRLDVVAFHAHEMLFGYVAAVASGFLLTAVRNWTGRATPTGWLLAALALLWAAGRVATCIGAMLPAWLAVGLDVAFLPAVAASLWVPLARSRNRRNMALPLILVGLAGADLAIQLNALGVTGLGRSRGILGSLDLLLVLMVIIGGRVIPMFTRDALRRPGVRRVGWTERLALPSVLLLLALDVVGAPPAAVAGVALAAALVHGVRMSRWGGWAARGVPLLWILHAGYAWIVVSLLLRALSVWWPGVVMPVLAIHALTVGAIGSLTMAMMSRSALGHTGRRLEAGTGLTAAFVLVNVAAVVRVFAPMIWPGAYLDVLLLSAGFWSAAFLLFLGGFWPVLTRPRIDGLPG
ncbi:MAG TPA: NnrS family protein [Gammaproteobacteria bacterium]|nr:NnrS family protein [Gammaproteobacteria bacterium]